jgi:predicted enzyme related to lactoylglutathione lyase
LFGWEKMEAMDMGPQGTYHIFGLGGRQLGGMFNPGPLPRGPLWIPYVLVADARRTSEIAKEYGAAITHGPSEVPGGDWVFTGVDRQGAVFAAHSKKRVAVVAAKKAAPTKVAAKKITTKKTQATKKASGRTRLQSRKKPTSKRR